MLYWGKTSIVYSPIYTKILFDRDFLGSEGSKFSAGSKFFDTPCSKWKMLANYMPLSHKNSRNSLIRLPLQPSPAWTYPSLHWQLKPPLVLTQFFSSLSWPQAVELLHSLMSREKRMA